MREAGLPPASIDTLSLGQTKKKGKEVRDYRDTDRHAKSVNPSCLRTPSNYRKDLGINNPIILNI